MITMESFEPAVSLVSFSILTGCNWVLKDYTDGLRKSPENRGQNYHQKVQGIVIVYPIANKLSQHLG